MPSNAEMISELEARGFKVNRETRTITPPTPTRRQTQALLSESYYGDDRRGSSSWLEHQLHPSKWRQLADRRQPWPKDVHPELALQQLSKVLAYRVATSGSRPPDMELDV